MQTLSRQPHTSPHSASPAQPNFYFRTFLFSLQGKGWKTRGRGRDEKHATALSHSKRLFKRNQKWPPAKGLIVTIIVFLLTMAVMQSSSAKFLQEPQRAGCAILSFYRIFNEGVIFSQLFCLCKSAIHFKIFWDFRNYCLKFDNKGDFDIELGHWKPTLRRWFEP